MTTGDELTVYGRPVGSLWDRRIGGRYELTAITDTGGTGMWVTLQRVDGGQLLTVSVYNLGLDYVAVPEAEPAEDVPCDCSTCSYGRAHLAMYPNTPAAIAPSADVPLAAWEIELLAGERWDVRFGDLITLNGGTYRVVDADGKPILEPEPPRIEEPGLWGVVEAGYAKYLPESGITYKFAKHDRYWISKSFPQLAAPWDDLIDPTLIREGLES